MTILKYIYLLIVLLMSVNLYASNPVNICLTGKVEVMFPAYKTAFMNAVDLAISLTCPVISGLDIIEKYQLHDESILITSHFESMDVRNSCLALGVKLIPKDMAALVPIIVS